MLHSDGNYILLSRLIHRHFSVEMSLQNVVHISNVSVYETGEYNSRR